MSESGKAKILEKVMSRAEAWRRSGLGTISKSSQLVAFHLACLSEEKFRMAALTGSILSAFAHHKSRMDLFALEWGLRSLPRLPDDKVTKAAALRNKWNDELARKCMDYLDRLLHYSTLRDLVVCAKRGGYDVTISEPGLVIFTDVKGWEGLADHKNHLVFAKIERDLEQELADRLNLGHSGGRPLDYRFTSQ